jgi:hypothetical protein
METTNKYTLEFLSNPLYSKKNTSISVDTPISKDERSFYRKRIISITKDMLKGEYVCSNLEKIHNDYIKSLIHHFKTIDEFEILQSEYATAANTSVENTTADNKKHIIDSSGCLFDLSGHEQIEINEIMMKQTNKRVSLDDFIMKKKINVKPIIPVPKKKEINVNTPAHKIKGIKPKQLKE